MITTFQMPVSKKGQVTIPLKIRKKLGLMPNEKVIFEVRDKEVKLKSPPFSIDEVFEKRKKLAVSDKMFTEKDIKDAFENQINEKWKDN